MSIAAYQGVCPTCRYDHSADTLASTTRETADHAELRRIEDVADWFERGDPGANGSVLLSASVAAEHAKDLRFALSEIAALRGELKSIEINHDIWVEIAEKRQNRATQAERQRDELRKALESIRDLGSDGEHSGDRHARCRDIARQALANQGADQ